MKRIAAILAAAVMFAAPATAQDAVSDHVGMLGFGYYNPNAPVGLRYWTSPSFGFDVGLGFKSENQVAIFDDASDPTKMNTTSLADFAFEVAVLLPLASEENMVVYVRPGIMYMSEAQIIGAAGSQKKESATTFAIPLRLGAEFFLTKFGFPNLSLAGDHGLDFYFMSPAGDGDSVTQIMTVTSGASVVSTSNLGFHFYF